MIIIIYLSVVGALLLYMAFLVLVDPLIRKPDAYAQPLHNEEENEVRLCCWCTWVAVVMVETRWWDGKRMADRETVTSSLSPLVQYGTSTVAFGALTTSKHLGTNLCRSC